MQLPKVSKLKIIHTPGKTLDCSRLAFKTFYERTTSTTSITTQTIASSN